jgi:4-amino-4-deoxy-L-arabinose transferase-like glycosyltransferase
MFELSHLFSFVKKHFGKRDILIILAIVSLYFLTRITNLLELPIFNDEGIYIHWAKVAWHDAAWRFVSLTDGKQPLQTWGTIPFLKLFPNDALMGGRMFSVATGFFALSGMFTLLFYLFGKKTAYIGSFLYVIIPYFLFYDRLAMVDSGVNGFFIWILFFSVLLARTMRFDVALMFGLTAGMGLLAKSSVRVFVGLSMLAGFLIEGVPFKAKANKKLPSFFVLFGITSALSLLIYNIQRLSPFLHFVEEKNKTFVMTFPEWLADPFAVVFHNVKIIPYYVFSELGWVIVPFAILGLIALYKKDRKLFAYFLAWILIPYAGIAFMTRVLFPRYIIFFGTLIVVLASYFLGQLKDKKLLALSLTLITAGAFFFNYPIWFDYSKIPLPPIDRGQYVEGATVGLGAREIIQYAREKSETKSVLILAEGNFGMSGDILDTFLRPSDTISIKGLWPLGETELRDHQAELKDKYVLVVLAQNPDYPKHWPVKLLKSYYKPGGTSVIHLLELTK